MPAAQRNRIVNAVSTCVPSPPVHDAVGCCTAMALLREFQIPIMSSEKLVSAGQSGAQGRKACSRDVRRSKSIALSPSSSHSTAAPESPGGTRVAGSGSRDSFVLSWSRTTKSDRDTGRRRRARVPLGRHRGSNPSHHCAICVLDPVSVRRPSRIRWDTDTLRRPPPIDPSAPYCELELSAPPCVGRCSQAAIS